MAHQHSCNHCEHHEHHHGHETSIRNQIIRIVATTLLLAVAMIIEHTTQLPTWQMLLIYLLPYFLIGYNTLWEAIEGLSHGQMFNEHFLMSIATIGALCIGFMPNAENEFAEAIFVMLFFQIGELFEGYAEGRSRDSIAHLMNLRPDMAHLLRNSKQVDVKPEEVSVGDTIVVLPGERVPLDGVVTEGHSSLDTSALTGESMPRFAETGDEIASGCVNREGLLHLQVIRIYKEGTIARILNLVENASEHKSRSESFITRFARVYTPIVVFAALALAFIPPLFAGTFLPALTIWLHRALIFLVVSCPCALVISVPLTFFGGIGGASRKGILIKGANYIDSLAKIDTVVFDKTGTLTCGTFSVVALHPEHCNEKQLLHLAAHVEHYSTHPIAMALRQAFPDEATDGCIITDVEERAGQGICATVGTEKVAVGNSKLMDAIGVQWNPCDHIGTIVHVAINNKYAGHIVISDTIKEDSAQAIEHLHRLGVKNTIMLTGDQKTVANQVAQTLNLDQWYAELMPNDKVLHIETLLNSPNRQGLLAFVGDGVNDAPVLARADIGIAMGALGSDAAIEAADVVLMDDKPSKIATAIAIGRRTINIANQNIWLAIGIKVAVLLLATIGIATMWMAAFADVGVTVIAVLNASRALRYNHE